jgi:hypothetical protein
VRAADLACAAVFVLLVAGVAAVATTGSDAFWPVALGDRIRASGSVPEGVPFAAAPTSGWVNTTALGQLVLSVVGSAGTLGLLAAQVVSVAVTLGLVAWDALRRGAPAARTALVLTVLAIGAATSLLVARVQLLSLVPFALLLVLLRSEHDRPSRRLWLVVPLLALWGNLHGAVLVGVAVTGCHLLFSRLRRDPVEAVLVGIGSLVAACANPGLWRAPQYYLGVLGGEATSDASGMWGRPDPANPFDLAMVVAAIVLGAMAYRRRRPAWEYVAVAGLAAGTVIASRNAVWLLLFLAGSAAASSASRIEPGPAAEPGRGPLPRRAGASGVGVGSAVVVLVGVLVASAILAVRAPGLHRHDLDVAAAARAAAGRVVLAPEPLSEELAAAGATVWVSNPLDAFGSGDQAAYLAFLRADATAAARALEQADVVIALDGSSQALLALAHGYRATTRVGPYEVLAQP